MPSLMECKRFIAAMSVHNSDDDEVDHNLVFTFISKLDLSHPLHFHPNDSTTLTIVSIKVKGTENYNVWSCAMLLAIEGRKQIGFRDNSYERSNTDEVLGSQWDKVNVVLKETFDRVDGSVTFNLHHKINSLTQNGSSVVEYFNKLSTLWKQFDALIQLPRFLNGIRCFYMQLRSNILSRDPLPDAKGAYVLISSEESCRAVVTSLGARSALEQPGIIFDSGANQHLTYTDKNLVNIIDISYLGIKISHPNGTEALITKVARDNKFIVGFDESKCFLMSQDLMDVKILRIGKKVNGLYYFEGSSDGYNSSPPSSPTIDHFEGDLGHPQGSNGFASENEMAATSDYEFAFSKDDDYDIQTTEHVQNVIN
ncbi:ribonuclease H-like domain-containing protein [Tanacetum coccineum]